MDKYVIDVPFLLRALLVRGIILQTRPKKSAAAYAKVWTDEGSPLIVLSKECMRKVKELVDVPVSLAMRYGNPSCQGYKNYMIKVLLCFFPLYPQHAMASTTTILELAEDHRKKVFSRNEIYDSSCLL
jgi:ferrochelatase